LSYVSLQSAILASFLQLMLPKIAGINLHEDRLAVSARLSRMAVPASAAVAVLLCLISPFLIPSLFGSDFKGAIPIALILFGAASAAFANAVLSDCLRGFGFPRRPMNAELLSSIAVAVLVLPLYWLWGLFGVALATVFGSILGFVFLSRYMSKDLHIPYRQFLLLKRDDIHFVVGRLRYLWQHYRA
jgi:O-antigen/teichoic acid export membrane protein